jgi:hypothetical protein
LVLFSIWAVVQKGMRLASSNKIINFNRQAG